MATHTQGPWRVGFEDGTGGLDQEDGAWIVGVEDEIVVVGGSHDGLKHGVTDESNARLIASAPDLLAAAKRALALLELQAEREAGAESKEADECLAPEGHLLREIIAVAEGG